MENLLSQRSRYRPSGRVAWGVFLPWAFGTAVIALAMGAGLNWLFQKGWYLLFVVPTSAALIAGWLVFLSVSKGKCRFPALGLFFGLIVGVLLYGGSFYFGMLSMTGMEGITRFDLFPKYILLRLNTDTSHDVGTPDTAPLTPDPYMNGFKFIFEGAIVLVFTTAAGYRRSQRSFCENCGTWKKQDLAVFPPGNGKVIAGWLEQGELGRLATIGTYSPRGRNKRATLVALERCEESGAEDCPVYVAVKDVTSAGASGRFDSAFGKLRVNRVELLPAEVAGLTSVFPAAVKLGAPAAASGVTTGPAVVGRAAFIEVKPIPENEAHKVLSKSAIAIGTVMGLLILPIFYGSIAGIFFGLYFSGFSLALAHKPFDAVRLAVGLLFSAVSLVVAILSGTAGLRNASAAGNLYFRSLSRRAIADRGEKWVDPERPGDLPTYFVQVVPRKNWGTMKWETATDTGFLQIDPRRKEIRFEGDVERYRIPAAAITSCSIAGYSTSASANLKYFVVVIQGRTATGPWEAPISLRPTRWLPPKGHRRLSAEMLLEQITPMLPASAGSASDGGGIAAPVLEELQPRVGWFSRFGLRLTILFLAIGLGVFRGLTNHHQRENQLGQIMGDSADLEPGEKTAQLPLVLTNPRFNQQIMDGAPYYHDGGDWTVFDCATADGSGAAFTVAIEKPNFMSSQMKIGFSQVALLPRDRESGASLVRALAAALKEESPATKPPEPLKSEKFSAVVLGQDLGSPEQGLKAGEGTWVGMRWLIANAELSGEIYFNYDLASGRAEFVGMNPTADADAIQVIAGAVRDGPRPPQSEQNDAGGVAGR